MKPVTLHDYKQRLLRVHMHIQQHLDAPLRLPTLAHIAHFAPHHFHRIFTGMTGETLQTHIRRLRLERAAYQLKTSRRPVTDIAFDAAYETHEAFTRAFRAAFNASPSEYRRRHNFPLQIPSRSQLHYSPVKAPRTFFTSTPTAKIMNDIAIKNLPPRKVAFLRHTGPYNEVGAAWNKLTMLLGKDGHLAGETDFIGICYDDPEITPSNKIRYDACVTVDKNFRPYSDIAVQEITGGEYAVLLHKGSFENLHKSYKKLLGQWLPRSGRELHPAHPASLEVYLIDPETTPPEELLTEICIRLA